MCSPIKICLIHENEVAFSSSKSSYFPGWNLTGDDVMVSFRSLNLLFVVDTQTSKIKWWRFGFAKRHDPDWQDGFVTVFNNLLGMFHRTATDFLRYNVLLWKINSPTPYIRTDLQHYTKHEGAHQLLGDEILLSLSNQGRVSKVDATGKLTFDFLNLWDEEKVLTLTHAIHLPSLSTDSDCPK